MKQRSACEIFVKFLLNHRRSLEMSALRSLWKNCARDVNDSVHRTLSSHTFRLPATYQSGTIPRCLMAAVNWPVRMARSLVRHQGHGNTALSSEGRTP